jgi:pimeloyl-ACP methyl ester carboxylesterase
MSRTVLFLPGAGGDPSFWRPLGERLPSAWTKTYLGWPGLGHQPARPEINGFDDLVRLVEEHLGETPLDLVAQSMGGAIALRVALRHPTRVRRLVLVATSGGIDVTSLGGSDWRPEYRQAFPHAAAWITAPFADLSDELPRVTQPTLLIWGDADPISPLAVGQSLRQLLPRSSLHIIPGGDHDLVQHRAPEVSRLIAGHLASH